MRILFSQVITKINIEKFYLDLNEKLIIGSYTLDDSVFEVNLGEN